MPFRDFPKEQYCTTARIDWWLDNTEPSSSEPSPASPEQSPPRRYNTRKRKREALNTTSGNAMGPDRSRSPIKKATKQTRRGRQPADGRSTSRPNSLAAAVSSVQMTPGSSIQLASTTSNSSPARSRSPIKTFGDWEWGPWPLVRAALDGASAQEASGFLAEYKNLRSAIEGDGVIPKSLKTSIEQIVHQDDQPKERCYHENDDNEHQYEVLRKAVEIRKAALECEYKSSNEATWNANVHRGLLKLAVQNPKYNGAVDFEYMTTARIFPRSLAAKGKDGDDWESKMIDYAITLESDSKLKSQIGRTLDTLPQGERFLNQTDYLPVKGRPIVIPIETKIPFTGGTRADLQLTGWTDAGVTKIKQLLKANGKEHERIPTMPLLSIYGHDVYLSGWYIRTKDTQLLGKLRLGGTESILGIFQILKALDILISWVNTIYRTWYVDNVLTPGTKDEGIVQ